MSDIFVFDHRKQLLDGGVIAPEEVVSSWQKQSLGGLISHELEVVYRPVWDRCIYFGMRDVDDAGTFWLYRVSSRKKSGHTIQISGIYQLFDDLKARGYIRDMRPENQPLLTVMRRILEGTGWEVRSCSHQKTASHTFYYQSRLSAFWDALRIWGAEFRPQMRWTSGRIAEQWIDFSTRFEEQNGRWYEYGDRLLTVEAQSVEDPIYTALVGRGKGLEIQDENGKYTGGYTRRLRFDEVVWEKAKGDPVDKPKGQEYVELPEETKQRGYADGTPRTGILEFPDIEDPKELLRATYEALQQQCRPKVQFRAEVLESRPVHLGEMVAIVRSDLGIRYQTRVFELERSFTDASRKTIRFGERLIIGRAEQILRERQEEQRKDEEMMGYIEGKIKNLNTDFLNGAGYNYELKNENPYGLPGGFYSFDKPIDQNPSKVIGISAGRLVIANRKTSTGAWEFRTFGTGDGFTADELRTGVLRGGKVFWNLETGELNIGGELHYSPSGGLDIRQITEKVEELRETTAERIEDLHRNLEENYLDAKSIDEALDVVQQGAAKLFDDASSEMGALREWLDARMGLTEEQLETLMRSVRIVDGTIVLTAVDASGEESPLSLRIQNDRIAFLYGGGEVAYIQHNRLKITDGHFLSMLQIGNFAFVPRSNGSLDFRKVV